ncbi:hypothetical protein F7734_50195 [Scytonema sp. UIC 10036]|uniref:hypothetical protein n=1 Tax=Scytonema sp. UIC 10036 TaxID=2304196 RepID=UPI0012DA64F0|nr:hypothetical protein [Scytonema sp. UIC 10036]MUH00019.1 hypothetical protein [Scytonema sp. UIC 10036]
MKNFLLELQEKAEKISVLTAFIESNSDGRELQSAFSGWWRCNCMDLPPSHGSVDMECDRPLI